MNLNTEKLFISDLDGTLLNNQGQLSKYSRDCLNELIDDGLNFTIASARAVSSIQNLLFGLKISLPIISFNGAFISCFESGRHQIVNRFGSEVAVDLWELINRKGYEPFISTYNGSEDCLYVDSIKNEGMKWYFEDRKRVNDKRLRPLENRKEVLKEQVVCFTVIGEKDSLDGLRSELEAQFEGSIEVHLIENQYSLGWYWLTVHDSKATKDRACAQIVKQLGFSLDNLTVFGDNMNDLKMFSCAGMSIAVQNAKDELKKSSSTVIESNQDDGVVKYLLSLQN